MNPSDAIEAIEKPLSSLPYSLSRHILEHLRKLTSHEPVIGIMGKSGAGKSSLCNALFQGEVTPVSDVHAGTREVRRFRLSGHGHSMIITDLPGVGESRDRDAEYEALYRDILPELDLVLWLIKADDRALSVDEYFWRHILHRGHQQVLFVVTQADKTEPCHEWDMAGIQPSPAQAQNIREKTDAVFRLFRPVHPVVAVSARTGWELDTLVSALMTALPDHAASPLMTRLQDELRTESVRGKATDVTMTSGGALIADSGATVEGTNASGKFSIDGTSGQASGLLLENGGSFTVNAGGLASNTTVGHRGTLTLAAGGSLSGRTQLSKGASMVLNGDVVSTGDIVNAGEIHFDNQTTQEAALSRAVAKSNSPVTFHKLTTTNLTGQGGTINMRVSLDGSNASDQLVINGGQATGKTWLAFTNVGNSNLGVATSGQGIRVVDAQNGATTEEGAFALSRPLQAGAFNYTLNRDSDEDWYGRYLLHQYPTRCDGTECSTATNRNAYPAID